MKLEFNPNFSCRNSNLEKTNLTSLSQMFKTISWVFISLHCAWCDAARDGVVLATEKKQKSLLYDDQTIHKVEQITQNVGMVYSGMGPDYRWHFCLIFLH